jgi:hypothetical protein|nr:MAG TPA: PROTEIN KINASE BYR2 [Caudoviricetes sp.]
MNKVGTETRNTKKNPKTLGDESKKVKLTHQERRFGQPNGNPRGHGFWKKEDTPRYKLEKMMKMSETELMEICEDKDAPLFERKLASFISKGEWDEIRGMIQEVYGSPKSTVITKVEVSDPYEGLTTEELKAILQTKPTKTEQK